MFLSPQQPVKIFVYAASNSPIAYLVVFSCKIEFSVQSVVNNGCHFFHSTGRKHGFQVQ